MLTKQKTTVLKRRPGGYIIRKVFPYLTSFGLEEKTTYPELTLFIFLEL